MPLRGDPLHHTVKRESCTMNQTGHDGELEIDLLALLRLFWQKIWIVLIAAAACGLIAFAAARFFIPPTYVSSAQIYVNNAKERTSDSVSTAEINAAKYLLEVYLVILRAPSTLDEVIEKADLPYTTRELSSMIKAEAVSNTEVFQVSVTSRDPEDARLIVETILEVLPDRIAEIVEGSSARIVSGARRPARSGPNVSRYAMIGLLVGLVGSMGVLTVLFLLDTTVHSSEYLTETYDIPILAVVPDMRAKSRKGYDRNYYSYQKAE